MMLFLAVPPFLAAILLTPAAYGTAPVDEAPLKDPLFVFEVTSNASAPDLKAVLSGMKVRHSFKFIGENQYLFVASSAVDNVPLLQNLNFPTGSDVKQYPVEHMKDFIKLFGVDHGWEEDDTEQVLSDIVQASFAQYVISENTPMCVYNEMLAAAGEAYSGIQIEERAIICAVLSSYPPSCYLFDSLDDNKVQHFTKTWSSRVGGPGNIVHRTKHAVKI